MNATKPRRNRIGLVAGVTTTLIAVLIAFELVAVNFRLFQEQSQIDASSGKTRHVSKWFGVENEGSVQETFLSDQLAGETVGGEPDWKPMTTQSGGLITRTHGHSSWDRSWHNCRRLEQLWDEGGFTIEARTECVRRLLSAFKSATGAADAHEFVDAIKDRVEELNDRPPSERQTAVEDLPVLDHSAD